MKPVLALIASLALICVAGAQTTAPKGGGADAGTQGGAAKKSAPGAKGATDKQAAAKKGKEEPPKIEGVEIPRGGDRGYLGIQIVNSTFKLSFYDAQRKPMAPDVTRAVLRWDPKYKVGDERVVLNRTDDGKALASPKNIRPPYHFKLFITLLTDAGEPGASPVGETHVIDFRQ